jgi:hypothetical protein
VLTNTVGNTLRAALAWLLSKGADIAPIPGTKRVERLEENVAADTVELTAEQLAALDNLRPAAGDRQNEALMRTVDGKTVRLRPRRTAGGSARGCRPTTGGRSRDTAGGPPCPCCSVGTANAWRNSWCLGNRRSGPGGCTGGKEARRDGTDRRSGQSATRFTVRSGNTPALTSSS